MIDVTGLYILFLLYGVHITHRVVHSEKCDNRAFDSVKDSTLFSKKSISREGSRLMYPHEGT